MRIAAAAVTLLGALSVGMALASCSAGGASATPPAPSEAPGEVPALGAAASLSVVYSVEGMDAVQVSGGHAYRPEKSAHHLLDVYRPEGDARLPAVLLVHGAAPPSAAPKDAAPFTSWARLIAASGMAAVTLNWDHRDPTDLDHGLAYLKAHADTLGLDMQRVGLVVFSAGVERALPWALIEGAGTLCCLVAYYGDLESGAEALAAAERHDTLRIMIARAGRDEIIRDDHLEAFQAAAAGRGLDVSVETHDEGVHAFDLRNNDQRSREIIASTLAFLRSNLGAP
jgi:acetyl esterase/lipase